MQTQRINISFPTGLLKQLQSEIPQGKRSKFIAKAVSEKLTKKRSVQKELRRSLQINREFYKKEYEDWKAIEIVGWPE